MELINIKHCIRIPIFNIQKNSNLHFYILVFSTILERCYIRGTHLPLPYHLLRHSGFRGNFLLLCPLFYSFNSIFIACQILFSLLSLAPVITFAIPRRVLWLVYILFYYMTAHRSNPLLSLPNSRAKQITLLSEAA